MKLLRYIKWLINDGRYIVIEGQHCGLCGAWYETKIMIPIYQYSFFDRWGICDKCEELGNKE